MMIKSHHLSIWALNIVNEPKIQQNWFFYKKIPEPVKKDITGPIFQHNQKLKGLNNSKSVQLNIDVCPLKNYKVKFTKKTEF